MSNPLDAKEGQKALERLFSPPSKKKKTNKSWVKTRRSIRNKLF